MTVAASGQARRRGRPPKAEAGDTREELLRAALRLFASRGYEGTSVRAIAREVGLSESVLYAHFESKRAIFDQVLAALGPLSAVTVLADLDPATADADPPAFVRSLAARAMDQWDSRESRQLISLMSQDDLIHDPALMTGIVGAMSTLADVFAGWIAAGYIAAEAGAPLDLAYALLSPIAMARLLWMHGSATPEDRATARDLATRHTEFFVRAVFPSAGMPG
jgi:AcrR family transcriptional regulator